MPEVVDVQSHLEPLAEPAAGREADEDPAEIEQLVREATGGAASRASASSTPTRGSSSSSRSCSIRRESLAAAHATASSVEEQIRSAVPGVAEVIVHTEP